MKYTELKKHIADGKLNHGYCFTGSDEFLKSWSVKMFRASLLNPDMNYTVLTDCDEKEILNALVSFPMFDSKRFVQIDNIPSDFSKLSEYFLDPCQSSVLISFGFPEPKSAKKKQELEKLKNYFTEIDCSPLTPQMLSMWIANEAKKFDAEVTATAANLLIEYCKSDLSRISGELTKLAAYKSGGVVDNAVVEQLVSPSTEYKIWELSSAIAAGDSAKALIIADKFEEDRTDFVVIFGAVYKHFHNLFFVGCSSEKDAVEVLGLSPYNYSRLQGEAKKFGMRKLKSILGSLSEIDITSKNGRLDRDAATRVMVSGITNSL